MIDPKFGMKLSKKANNPKNNAKSNPNRKQITPNRIPVIKLTTVFTLR